MARTTFFTVQPIERRGKRLVQAPARQCKTAEEALRVGERLAASHVGVVVYTIEGDADFDDWGEPKVLATHGEVPENPL
jgi:hypothetical protein